MERNVWTRACSDGSCVEVQWMSACSSGSCVEVGWASACASGTCVEVRHDGARVLVRDGKLGDESAVYTFTPAAWRTFLAVATDWDRGPTIASGVILSVCDDGVCVRGEGPEETHLHFTGQEWDEFVAGVKNGLFEVTG